ncbi:basic amino acid ABC transporter substrate-binding protein [Phytoactinopolyspora halophila]|nr:basic amino acid ABC transporter substrate-binding protein [Phytoactinopolyspora halophila]
MRIRNYRVFAACAALALAMTACGDDADDTGDDTATSDDGTSDDGTSDDGSSAELELMEEGTLRVGSDIDFPPFEMVEDDEIVGFDVDLMEEIADRLGVEVEWVDTPFDTIFTQLAAGDFDAIISGITITEDRQQTVDFSDPYFESIQSVVVRTDSDISGVADLADADVGVQAGTTGEAYAQENFTDSTVRDFPTYPAAFTALETEGVDAVFADLPAAESQVEGSDVLEIAEEVDTGERYGIAVQPDDEAMRSAINEQLEAIIADGTYEEIYAEWFDGQQPPESFRS